MSPPSLEPVLLLALPLELHRRAAAHQEALQREFDILRLSQSDAELPERLQRLIADLELRFGGFTGRPEAELAAALASDADEIDLTYHLPASAGLAAAELGQMLDEVDQFCQRGEHLVTLATPAELRRYRDWFLGEFTVQLAGGSASPWPVWSREHEGVEVQRVEHRPLQSDALASGSTSSSIRLTGALDLEAAGALRERVRSAGEATRQLTIDLTDVDFIDSVALSVIVSAHIRAEEQGSTLQLVVPPHLRQLFTMTGLDRVLSLVDT